MLGRCHSYILKLIVVFFLSSCIEAADVDEVDDDGLSESTTPLTVSSSPRSDGRARSYGSLNDDSPSALAIKALLDFNVLDMNRTDDSDPIGLFICQNLGATRLIVSGMQPIRVRGRFCRVRLNMEHMDAVSRVLESLGRSLIEIDFSQSDMGVDGFNYFVSKLEERKRMFPLLTGLNLSHNKLNDKSADAVRNLLQRMPHLRQLDMSQNRVGDNVASVIVAHATQLRVLDLQQNRISARGADNLATKITGLETLNIDGNALKGTANDILLLLATTLSMRES